MPDQRDRAFAVTCGHCGTLLLTVPQLRAAELAVIAAHLRTCWPHDPLPERPHAGELLRRVQVVPVTSS